MRLARLPGLRARAISSLGDRGIPQVRARGQKTRVASGADLANFCLLFLALENLCPLLLAWEKRITFVWRTRINHLLVLLPITVCPVARRGTSHRPPRLITCWGAYPTVLPLSVAGFVWGLANPPHPTIAATTTTTTTTTTTLLWRLLPRQIIIKRHCRATDVLLRYYRRSRSTVLLRWSFEDGKWKEM